MSRCLLTQSLLNSWLYTFKARDGNEDAAQADFIDVLNRVERPPNEAMTAGIHFESVVNAIVDKKAVKTDWIQSIGDTKGAEAIAKIVSGGQPQAALHKDKTINGINFLLYGKLDYLKAGTIYDIKYSKTYEAGKYLSSIQHPFYFELCPDALWFEYLVSNGSDVFVERYTREATERIDAMVEEFIAYLYETKLDSVYFDKWVARD